ncbi:Fc.00g027690.m01.CDS01 [Cosmosporella sp. VM-42]
MSRRFSNRYSFHLADDPSASSMFPRRYLDPKYQEMMDDRLALSSVPVSTGRFLEVLKQMHVPSIFLDTIYRPKSLFRKFNGSVGFQACEVYILCVDSILKNFTAMCITYFPQSQQVFSVYLGYASDADVTDMTSRILGNKDFIYNPFVLISAFLELEKAHRVMQVDDKFGQLLRSGETGGPGLIEPGEQSSAFAENYQDVGVLKTYLLVWISVLDNVSAVCPALPVYRPPMKDGLMISPGEYIKALKDSYEQMVLRSENYLQTASLNFQLAQADSARRDAKIAINDAKQMKAIALLTMFFLPATAVAGFMDAPIYDWEGRGYFFWVITVPITFAVLSCYFAWTLLVHQDG